MLVVGRFITFPTWPIVHPEGEFWEAEPALTSQGISLPPEVQATDLPTTQRGTFHD